MKKSSESYDFNTFHYIIYLYNVGSKEFNDEYVSFNKDADTYECLFRSFFIKPLIKVIWI